MTARVLAPPPRSSSARLVALVVVLTLAAAAILFGPFAPAGSLSPTGPLAPLALAGLFAVAEVVVVHVHVRKQAQTFSLSEIPVTIALVFLAPGTMLAARLVGAGAALVVHRRQRGLKLAFNEALFAFDTAVVVLVFRGLAGEGAPFGARAAIAACLATGLSLVVCSVAIAMAIAAVEGGRARGRLPLIVGLGSATTAASTLLGFLSVLVLRDGGMVGVVLLVIAGAGLFTGFGLHARLRREHQSLTQVYDFTRVMASVADGSALEQALLVEACRLLRAAQAEMIVTDPDGNAVSGVRWDGAQLTAFDAATATDVFAGHLALLGGQSLTLLPRGRRPGVDAGPRDAVIAELADHEGRIGTLAVLDRLGDVDSFDGNDQRLLATLVTHATVALRGLRLIDRLRVEVVAREHQASHDGLTGLPNRTMLDRRLREIMATTTSVGALLVDLDRFKEVNDTLGHHRGDELLIEVGQRVRAVAPAESIVARLGGDEFAVLLPGVEQPAVALAAAAVIHAALDQPFDVAGLSLDIGASVGVVVGRSDACTPAVLLQQADIAMYTAKRSGTSVALYNPSTDEHSTGRLLLASQLRHTVERDELQVVYQPKADLLTGRIVGAEALARWHHPEHGSVPPPEFVAIAERSGLIRGLTRNVLRAALAQCRYWRADGFDMHVAVNLSPRNLLDDQLPAEVARCLEEAGLPPSALMLEITENTVVDHGRIIGLLSRLSAMGVGLAIDDFGTGYSSLSYLKRLPVEEVKIDRSFVTNLTLDSSDAVIVRSTIELARNLSLRVTAEGVEDERTWQALANDGCHQVQGYFLSRPLSAHQFHRWLQQRRAVDAGMADLHDVV